MALNFIRVNGNSCFYKVKRKLRTFRKLTSSGSFDCECPNMYKAGTSIFATSYVYYYNIILAIMLVVDNHIFLCQI